MANVSVVNLCEYTRSKTIVSDGDFDAVTADIILGYVCGPVNVVFPAPFDNNKYDNAVVVERPQRAGANSVIIDHHTRDGKITDGYVAFTDATGKITTTISVDKSASSVAKVVYDAIGKPRLPPVLEALLAYADIIDSTPPNRVPAKLKEAGLDPKVYYGYRLLISSQVWRRRVAELLSQGKALEAAEYLISLFKRFGENQPLVEEKARELASKAVTVDVDGLKIAVFPVEIGKDIVNIEGISVDIQQAALKPAMGMLSSSADIVVAFIKSPKGNGVSVSSSRGLALDFVNTLKAMGLAASAGGRPQVAGAQGLKIGFEEFLSVLPQVVKACCSGSSQVYAINA